jgi:hypothetical protein
MAFIGRKPLPWIVGKKIETSAKLVSDTSIEGDSCPGRVEAINDRD